MEANHTHDEAMRGVDLSEVPQNLADTVKVLDLLHSEFGEIREGTEVIPGTE